MFGINSFITRPRDVSEEDCFGTNEVAVSLHHEALAEAKYFREQQRKLRIGYHKDLHELLGRDNALEYLALRKKGPPYLKGINERYTLPPDVIQKKRADHLAIWNAYHNKSDIDLDAISKLRKAYNSKLIKAEDSSLLAGEEQVREDDKVRKNQDFNPPFHGWAWQYSWRTAGLARTPTLGRYLDHEIGVLGSYSTVRNERDNPSDDDYSNVLYRTAARVWFQLPETGSLSVRQTYEFVINPMWGYITNERGNSGMNLYWSVRPYAQVTHPIPSSRVKSWLHTTYENYSGIPGQITSDNDYEWARQYLYTGAIRTSYHTIAGVFKKNDWIVVDAGIQLYNRYISNDCNVRSSLDQKFLLRQIGVTVL